MLVFGSIKLGLLLLLLAMSALAAYEAGLAKNAARIERLQSDIDEARQERLRLIAEKQSAEERVVRLRKALAQLEGQYEKNIPDGAMGALMGTLKQRLAHGVPLERLSFVIEHATNERSCDDMTETRELQARTPVSTALNYTETFMSGLIIVSADGVAARDADGNALDRFDPDQPVALRFLLINGEIERVEATLPLAHSIVLDGSEYRFRAVPGNNLGTIKLIAQRCNYP